MKKKNSISAPSGEGAFEFTGTLTEGVLRRDHSRALTAVTCSLTGDSAAKKVKLELHKVQWDIIDVITHIKARIDSTLYNSLYGMGSNHENKFMSPMLSVECLESKALRRAIKCHILFFYKRRSVSIF